MYGMVPKCKEGEARKAGNAEEKDQCRAGEYHMIAQTTSLTLVEFMIGNQSKLGQRSKQVFTSTPWPLACLDLSVCGSYKQCR